MKIISEEKLNNNPLVDLGWKFDRIERYENQDYFTFKQVLPTDEEGGEAEMRFITFVYTDDKFDYIHLSVSDSYIMRYLTGEELQAAMQMIDM